MEYSPFSQKDVYQVGYNEATAASMAAAKRLPNDSSFSTPKVAGLGLSELNGSAGTESGISRDSEISGLTSEAAYKQKLRTGVRDFLQNINESRYRTATPYSKGATSAGFSGQEQFARGFDAYARSSVNAPAHRDRAFQSRSYKKLNDRKKLYRSNSSLELDHFNKDCGYELKNVSKDYGSANSLDAVQTGGNFSSLVQTYRQDIENLDRLVRAAQSDDAAPRGMIGAFGVSLSTRTINMQQQHYGAVPAFPSNPTLCSVDGSTITSSDTPHSPKPDVRNQKMKENKSRNEGGIFRKLRGVKSDPSGAASAKAPTESTSKSDVCNKAFCHYDCQSISVRISDVIRRRADLTGDMSFKRLNVTTGASAASVARVVPSNSTTDLDAFASGDDSDVGDRKSNKLLLSCSFFHNELGGEEIRSLTVNRSASQRRMYPTSRGAGGLISDPRCNGVAVLDSSLSPKGSSTKPYHTAGGYVFEYFDNGAFYYRHFFSEYDHQNFFGIDDGIGPVAISIRREKVYDKDLKTSAADKTDSNVGWFYQYRVIVRTSELTSLRGIILEDNIPSSSRLSSAKGLLAKDILDFVVPSLNTSCLHQATSGTKTSELLMKVDEHGISKAYKIGVMLCKAGQSTEEEMYNNEFSSPAFDEFLNLIGTRVKLKGFEHYRGGLDVKSDSTGTESFYTRLEDNEIMFHVSTLLPFTPNNKQQLLRKRHIGNDIVTIIFQEPDALPFTPKSIRSQFQHVFIVVRVHNPNSDNTRYSIAVSRSKNVPYFGPVIPEGAVFSRSEQFKEFLLVKTINGENAVHKSDKFMAMAVRTRQEYLKELAVNHVISSSIESGSRLSKLTLGSGRKKDKARLVRIPDNHSKAAVVWSVHVEDFAYANWINCVLGLALETIVIVDEATSNVLFTTSCQSVIGWTLKTESNSLKLFYNQGECVHLSTSPADLKEIVCRLELVTGGCQTEEKNLYRNSEGHLGFHVFDGIISEIDPTGPAYITGLKSGSNIVEVCSVIAATLTQDELIEFLRTSKNVTISVIPPSDTGKARSYKPDSVDGSLEPSSFRQHGNLSWKQQSHLSYSNHSSLERKGSEMLKASNNDLHAASSLEDVTITRIEGGHSNEFQVTFSTSFQPQNPYRGSNLSLYHRSENTSTNPQRNSSGPAAMNSQSANGFGGSLSATSDELKQIMMTKNPSIQREQHYQMAQYLQQLQSSGWYGADNLGKSPGPNFGSGSNVNSDLQTQHHLAHSHSFNKGTSGSFADHGSPLRLQPPGLDGAPSSDSVNGDSRTRFRKSTMGRLSNNRMTPSKSFQKELIRLIDTEVPPSEIWLQGSDDNHLEFADYSQLRHSDDNICASSQKSFYSSAAESGAETFQHRTRSGNVVEIPGTIYRLQTSRSSAAIPLPVASNTADDWTNLVDAADRALEVSGTGELNDRTPLIGTLGRQQATPASSSLTPSGKALMSYYRGDLGGSNSWKATKQDSSSTGHQSDENASDANRTKELESKVASLESQLQKERKDRAIVELEMDHLRKENIRLQEESQAAAAQLRKFTAWFFETIDKR